MDADIAQMAQVGCEEIYTEEFDYDDLEDPDDPDDLEVVPVLCQCGWGSLAMLASEVPAHCPVCDYPLGGPRC